MERQVASALMCVKLNSIGISKSKGGVGVWHASRLLLKRLSKMNKVKAHTLRKYEEAKLVEELTMHRVSYPCEP